MSFETAADDFIRPRIRPAATPAHAAAAVAETSSRQATTLAEGAAREPGAKSDHETGPSEFGFYDLIDIVNPLQHLPGISTAYRALMGDEIEAPARILGGALYGGPLGMVASIANVAVEESSGRDIGETAIALVFGDEPAGGGDLAATPATVPVRSETALLSAADHASAAMALPEPQIPTAPPAKTANPETPANQGNGPADPALSAAAQTDTGPVLTGKAAINAFLHDLAGLGRDVAGAPAQQTVGAQQAAISPTRPAATVDEKSVPANLAGLGGRDLRPDAQGGQVVARIPTAPRASAPQPGRDQAGQSSVAGPRLPGKAAIDPTSFAINAGGTVTGEDSDSPANDFSAQMMRALQKYESMLQDRLPTGGDPG